MLSQEFLGAVSGIESRVYWIARNPSIRHKVWITTFRKQLNEFSGFSILKTFSQDSLNTFCYSYMLD